MEHLIALRAALCSGAPASGRSPLLRNVAMTVLLIGFVAVTGLPSPAHANEADVLDVKLKCRGLVCDFHVTLEHGDQGWKHYADGWEVLSEDRAVIATRVLRHPHVKEQPFTRSLAGVKLPKGTTRVIVRGHDKLHGHGGAELVVEIPAAKNPTAASPSVD